MKKRWKIFLAILILIIAVRIALEPVALHYVNKTLANLEGYRGSVKDIDIALYRGAYSIDSLDIEKVQGDFPEPFFSCKSIDISLEWKTLFKGVITGEIILKSPVLNFTKSISGNTQSGKMKTGWK